MHFFTTVAPVALLTASANALVARSDTSNSTAQPSSNFTIHARCATETDFTNSPGYLHAEYSYPPGYFATFVAKEDAIVGHLTDTQNASNSALDFDRDGFTNYGFKLYPLTEEYTQGLTHIFAGQEGTQGMFVDGDGLLQYQNPEGRETSWYVCLNAPLERSRADALYYKFADAAIDDYGNECYDVDLVVEYV
ncbi:hypothetical protein MBLNU230_g2280t1 [Neophaeotheca triangularis]